MGSLGLRASTTSTARWGVHAEDWSCADAIALRPSCDDGRRVRRLFRERRNARGSPMVATTTSTEESDYVARLNELCAELVPQVIDAYGGAPYPAPFPIEEFNVENPKLMAVTEAFDAKADAIPVAAADEEAQRRYGGCLTDANLDRNA